jgi:hypothetical protein
LPTGVTVVGVREDEAAQKFVEQDDVERDLLAEQFDEKAQVTVPFLLVMDSGGIVRHVQTNYRGARDLTEVDGVVRSVRAMSDMR